MSLIDVLMYTLSSRTAKIIVLAAISLFPTKIIVAQTVFSDLSHYDAIAQKLVYDTQVEKGIIENIDSHTLYALLRSEEMDSHNTIEDQPLDKTMTFPLIDGLLFLADDASLSINSKEIQSFIESETSLFINESCLAIKFENNTLHLFDGIPLPVSDRDGKDKSNDILFSGLSVLSNFKNMQSKTGKSGKIVCEVTEQSAIAQQMLNDYNNNGLGTKDNFALYLYIKQKNPEDDFYRLLLFSRCIDSPRSIISSIFNIYNNFQLLTTTLCRGYSLTILFSDEKITHSGESI